MTIFWCKNDSYIRYKMLLFTEKQSMCIYSGFYQGLSGYYKVFKNYIASLTFTKKFILASIFKWLQDKNEVFENQNFYMKCYPHHPFCRVLSSKSQKKVTQKSLRVLKFFKSIGDKVFFIILSDGGLFTIFDDKILFRVLRDSVLFRVLSDRVLFRVLQDAQ